MLGLWALGSAALGTDGVTRLSVSISGVASASAVGSVADPGASLHPGSVYATCAPGNVGLSISESNIAAGVAATCAVGSVLGYGLSSVVATASVAPITPSPRSNASGVSATGSVGSLYESEQVPISGVYATGVAGGAAASINSIPAGVFVAGSVAAVFGSVNSADYGTSAIGAAGSLASFISNNPLCAYGIGVVGGISGFAGINSAGVAGDGFAGSLIASPGGVGAGVFSAAFAGSVTAGVSVNFGSQITSDGVLGLWVLGDAALGVDTPDISPFIGVGCFCSVGAAVDASGSGVSSIASTGDTTASVSESPDVSGVEAVGAAGATDDSLSVGLPGVSATGIASSPVKLASVGQVTAVCAVGPCSNDDVFDAPGVFALGSAGGVSIFTIPGISVFGVSATGMAGHLRMLVPSSAIGLWGTPVPGGTVTASFAGLTSVSVTVGTGQTLAQVAGALATAINGNFTLMAAGISVGVVANILTIHQPDPALISSSLSMTGT